jgi:hypothetical protein
VQWRVVVQIRCVGREEYTLCMVVHGCGEARERVDYMWITKESVDYAREIRWPTEREDGYDGHGEIHTA